MPASDPGDILVRSRLFEDLPAESLGQLAATATFHSLDHGEVLFSKGDPGTDLHIIVSGQVRVYVENDGGGEIVVAILGPGDCVGELSMIDGAPRSATVEALEPVETLAVPREAFTRVLHATPQTMASLLVTLAVRIRQTTALTADLAFLDLFPESEGRAKMPIHGPLDRSA